VSIRRRSGFFSLESPTVILSFLRQMSTPITAPDVTLYNAVLTVSVLGAKDLPAMDSNGKSDPYVKLGLCPLRPVPLPSILIITIYFRSYSKENLILYTQ